VFAIVAVPFVQDMQQDCELEYNKRPRLRAIGRFDGYSSGGLHLGTNPTTNQSYHGDLVRLEMHVVALAFAPLYRLRQVRLIRQRPSALQSPHDVPSPIRILSLTIAELF
jgi:hypothetical protein